MMIHFNLSHILDHFHVSFLQSFTSEMKMFFTLRKRIFVNKHTLLMQNLFIQDIMGNQLYQEVLFRFIINENYPLKQYRCYIKCKNMLKSMESVWNENNWAALCELRPTGRKIINEEIRKYIFEKKPNLLLHKLNDIMHDSLKRLENDVDYIRFENSLRLKSESIKKILRDIYDERNS